MLYDTWHLNTLVYHSWHTTFSSPIQMPSPCSAVSANKVQSVLKETDQRWTNIDQCEKSDNQVPKITVNILKIMTHCIVHTLHTTVGKLPNISLLAVHACHHISSHFSLFILRSCMYATAKKKTAMRNSATSFSHRSQAVSYGIPCDSRYSLPASG